MNRLTITRAAIRFAERLTKRAKDLHVTSLVKVLNTKYDEWMQSKADTILLEDLALASYERSIALRSSYSDLCVAVDTEILGLNTKS